MKNDLVVENISFDTSGRIIVFDVHNITHCNVYLEAGSDSVSRSNRENYLNETLPSLLTNRCSAGYVCGDWNCLAESRDATHYSNSKISKSLKRLIKVLNWKDSHLDLYPYTSDFSHYYTCGHINGASRIDRQYVWGLISASRSFYVPLAFSDHYGLIIDLNVSSLTSHS